MDQNRGNIFKNDVEESKEEIATGGDRTHFRSYKIIFYDGKSFYLRTGMLAQGFEQSYNEMIQIREDNIAKCVAEIIDIKSMTNWLTAEQVLNKFYEYIGIISCFIEPSIQVDIDSYKSFDSLNNDRYSNNLLASTLSQRRKYFKLDKNQI